MGVGPGRAGYGELFAEKGPGPRHTADRPGSGRTHTDILLYQTLLCWNGCLQTLAKRIVHPFGWHKRYSGEGMRDGISFGSSPSKGMVFVAFVLRKLLIEGSVPEKQPLKACQFVEVVLPTSTECPC